MSEINPLTWSSAKLVRDCTAQLESLETLASKLPAPGSKHDNIRVQIAREWVEPQIERFRAGLAALPSIEAAIEAARGEYRAALAELNAHAAAPLPTDVDSELRRLATRNILTRALEAKHAAFITATRRFGLPYLEGREAAFRYEAQHETDALADVSTQLAGREQGYRNRAFDLGEAQGKTMTDERAKYLAYAELDYADDPRCEQLFAIRWYFYAVRNGLPYDDVPAQDYPETEAELRATADHCRPLSMSVG
jgi:hypothetical protein